ncbi:MAG TPA: hypothetical protein VGS28_01485 [Candidatus Saccharimonadales bacterium]|nr:hypothetical protein [Candidatus Saccharimonadales bacterium]
MTADADHEALVWLPDPERRETVITDRFDSIVRRLAVVPRPDYYDDEPLREGRYSFTPLGMPIPCDTVSARIYGFDDQGEHNEWYEIEFADGDNTMWRISRTVGHGLSVDAHGTDLSYSDAEILDRVEGQLDWLEETYLQPNEETASWIKLQQEPVVLLRSLAGASLGAIDSDEGIFWVDDLDFRFIGMQATQTGYDIKAFGSWTTKTPDPRKPRIFDIVRPSVNVRIAGQREFYWMTLQIQHHENGVLVSDDERPVDVLYDEYDDDAIVRLTDLSHLLARIRPIDHVDLATVNDPNAKRGHQDDPD